VAAFVIALFMAGKVVKNKSDAHGIAVDGCVASWNPAVRRLPHTSEKVILLAEKNVSESR